MRKILAVFMVLAAISCARVNLRTQEPLRVDINMRVDVYQHVVKDVESIEGQVYGQEPEQSNRIFVLKLAYADERSPETEPAVQRRKKRMSKINDYFGKGYIGENRKADLEMRARDLPPDLHREIEKTIREENKDREIIYRAVAKKRGANVSEVRKVFFEDHHKRAPAGSWFEVYDKEKGKYIWVKK